MRLMVICLIVGMHLSVYASAQRVTLNQKNARLAAVLKEIKQQTGFNFLYDADAVEHIKGLNLSLNNVPLEDALKRVLEPNNLTYEKRKEVIVIQRNKRNTPLPDLTSTKRQEMEVTGIVVDENGDPLTGVSVLIEGREVTGTSTDRNGRFVLAVPSLDVTLVFRQIGFLTQEIMLEGERSIEVILEQDTEGIEEIVVVGFGEQKRESLVSSVATVKGEELRMPNRSLSNNIAGRVAGIVAVQRSGEPGYDDSEFYIRGVSSFSGGRGALILVDGIPRDMNDIEPDEIETFTVLKDAAATAIYGAEGANGVVLITSKRGSASRTNITYRGEYSRLTPTRVPRFASSADYLTLYNEGLVNDGEMPMFSDELIQRYASGEDPDLYPNSQWWDMLMRDNTNNTRHTLNFRGGGDRMRFFVSGAYFGESGLYNENPEYNNNAGVNRYNLRSNVDIDITNSMLLRVDLAGQYLENNYPGSSTGNIFSSFARVPPHLFPGVYSDGTLPNHPDGVSGTRINPYVQLMESGYRNEWRSFLQSKVQLEQRLDFLTEGLRVRGVVSYDSDSRYHMSRTRTPDSYFATGRDEFGDLIYETITNEVPFGNPNTSSSGVKKLYLESALDYNRLFGNHDVSGMALYYQKDRQLHNEALSFRTQAFVGRGVYTYDRRYSLEANFGITGSENFAEGHRFGFFPAVGLSWNLTNEPYYPESLRNILSSFKVRASIGRTGNDDTGGARFLYRPTFSSGSGYSWGIGSTGSTNGMSGLVEGRFAVPSLGWEIEMKRNIAIDASLWNDMLTLQFDYFNNHRSHILLQRRTVSHVAGFRQAPWQNYGEVANKGFDASLNFNHQIGEVTVGGMGTFTFARNEIVEYDEVPQVHPWLNRTGTQLNGQQDLFIAERLFTDDDFIIGTDGAGNPTYQLREGIAETPYLTNTMPGDIKYVDINGDGIVDDLDRVRNLGHPLFPEIIYGFGMNFGYKGFYVNAFFQGAGNVSVNLMTDRQVMMPFEGGVDYSNVRQEIVESRWTPENPSQDVFFPRMRVAERSNTWTRSTWWMRDGSFLRFKNLEAGYNFDTEKLFGGKIRNARLYVLGHNIAVWDHVKIYDPELGTSGGGSRYPLPSTWTVGLEMTF